MLVSLTLAALVERHLAEQPDGVAFIEGEREITYAEFDLLCRKAAAWLTGQGIGAGDRVAVWIVNRVEWLALFFGLARIGAVLVPVNTRYRSAELVYILERSGARMLVLQLNFRKIDFQSVLEQVDVGAVQTLERIAVMDAGSKLPAQILGKPTTAFDLSQEFDVTMPDRSDPDALAILFTTSGTTKGPKLVMHLQRTIALHSWRVARAFAFDEPDARSLAAVPFCGVFGLMIALGALTGGAPSYIMEIFDGQLAADLVRRHAISHAFGSDEMLRRMADAVGGHNPFPSLRVCGFGAYQAGAMDFARAALERRIPMVGMYGSSEVLGLFSQQPMTMPFAQIAECGGFPVSADTEVRIRDIEKGELLPPGVSGEIEIRARTNFVGYFNDSEATAKAIGPDGFFRTGDIGHLRGDGTFVYETRQGDAIRLGGFLVNPVEIEDMLKRLPGVADVQVLGVDISGHGSCVAFVIWAHGSVLSDADVIAWAAANIAGFKVPSRVWFVDEFPTTQSANGVKIQRAKLRTLALEHLGTTLRK